MRPVTRTLAALTLSCGLGACGVTASSTNPGFADISVPRNAGLKRDTSISIGPALLGFAARHADEDPETMALLNALDGVRVRVYAVGEESDPTRLSSSLETSAKSLRDDDWRVVVRVADEDSRVHVLVREGGGQLLGLALMSLDREELVLVNVMGRLAPEMLDTLTRTIDEDVMALRDAAP
ncbi:MAG: DUF4252 domain-containing protein [Pseudomonadota bacterium]